MIDIVEGWNGRGGVRQGARRCRGIRVVEIGIVDHIALLIDSVLVDRLHDIGCAGRRAKGVRHGKPIVEPSVARAHDRFRRSLADMTRRPGQRKSRTPISVVMNTILGLKAQTVAQGKVRPSTPIVLIKKSSIEQKRTRQRILNHCGLILRGRLRQVLVDRSE